MPRLGLPVAFLVACIFASQAHSIVRRDDLSEAPFLELGLAYPALAHLNLSTSTGAGDGEGCLIAPKWILTAAHVGVEIEPGHLVTVGGLEYPVESVIIHPEWDDGPHDLALVLLARPVEGVSPATLYRASDEVDAVVALVGYGDFGTGLTGPLDNDGRVRGATNRIDIASEAWLKFAFDPPGDARTTPLEGVSGPGDSGGPAFLLGVDTQILIGVSSGQSTRATGGQPGRYGVVEYYVRVSRYVEWIDETIGSP